MEDVFETAESLRLTPTIPDTGTDKEKRRKTEAIYLFFSEISEIEAKKSCSI